MSISFDLASLVSKEIHSALEDLDIVDVSICRQKIDDLITWKIKIYVLFNSCSFGVGHIVDPEFVLKSSRIPLNFLASRIAEKMVKQLRGEIEKTKPTKQKKFLPPQK